MFLLGLYTCDFWQDFPSTLTTLLLSVTCLLCVSAPSSRAITSRGWTETLIAGPFLLNFLNSSSASWKKFLWIFVIIIIIYCKPPDRRCVTDKREGEKLKRGRIEKVGLFVRPFFLVGFAWCQADPLPDRSALTQRNAKLVSPSGLLILSKGRSFVWTWWVYEWRHLSLTAADTEYIKLGLISSLFDVLGRHNAHESYLTMVL